MSKTVAMGQRLTDTTDFLSERPATRPRFFHLLQDPKLWIVLLFLLAILMRVYRLGDPSLWHDEAHTWWLARLPWTDLLQALRELGVHPPVFFTLEKITIGVFGESEAVLRLVPVVADLLTLAIVMQIGLKLGGRAGMIGSGWFWTFHPMAIWYARDARPYSLATLFAATTIYAYLKLRERPSLQNFALGLLTLSLGLMTHFFVWAVGFSLILIALAEFKDEPRSFRLFTFQFFIALIPLGAWLAWYLLLPDPMLGIGWISRPRLWDILPTLWNLFSGYAGEVTLASTLFGVIGFTFVICAQIGRKTRSMATRTFFLGLIVPIFSVWLVSQRRPIYMDRYFSVFLPSCALIVAIGAARAWRVIQPWVDRILWGWSPVVLSLAFLWIGLQSGYQVHTNHVYAKEEWRDLSGVLEVEAMPEVWFSDPESVVALRFYLQDRFVWIQDENPPTCQPSCWWVLRQPYTATHAFTQVITQADRDRSPLTPNECRAEFVWQDYAGLMLWHLTCTNGRRGRTTDSPVLLTPVQYGPSITQGL
ncbi:MAG: hypothetical protein GTO14_04090 [Anaerolineales bacterium]|nr:hypothetical protein [Anaerolineales bacterium]